MEFNRLKQSEFHQCRAEQSRAREKPSLQTDMYFISISIIISSHLKTVTTVEIMIFSLHFGMNGMEWMMIFFVCAEYNVCSLIRSHDEIYSSKSNSSSQFRYPFNDGSNIHYYYYYIHLRIQRKKYI